MVLLRRVSQHLHHEGELMQQILDADLSEGDWKILREFMETHSHHLLAQRIISLNDKIDA
jgi:hypothetical protein